MSSTTRTVAAGCIALYIARNPLGECYPAPRADGALLRRALWNLVENAAKYGAPPITLAAERAGDRVRLSVADDGPGIPPAERERVFTPFYRGGRARTPDGTHGVGLGLTIARRVAEVHGGGIAVESVDGEERGCRIVITLPADAAA